jgi:hypothetical protein
LNQNSQSGLSRQNSTQGCHTRKAEEKKSCLRAGFVVVVAVTAKDICT